MKKLIRQFSKEQSGATMLLFAGALPLIILMVVGTLEIGSAFVEQSRTLNLVKLLASEVRSAPKEHAANRLLATQYADGERHFCTSRPFASYTEAVNADLSCSQTSWAMTADAVEKWIEDEETSQMYVKLVGKASRPSLTGLLWDVLPAGEASEVMFIDYENSW